MILDSWKWIIGHNNDNLTEEQLIELGKKIERINDKIDDLIRQELQSIDSEIYVEIR